MNFDSITVGGTITADKIRPFNPSVDPVIDLGDVDVYSIPRRSFDPSKGDRRFTYQGGALRHAEAKALETGIRQVVRQDSEIPGAHAGRFWLVQAIGS